MEAPDCWGAINGGGGLLGRAGQILPRARKGLDRLRHTGMESNLRVLIADEDDDALEGLRRCSRSSATR